jgi:twinkle protein
MDNDTAGHKAAKELGELFGAKAKLIKITGDYNDLCDINIDGARGSAMWKTFFFGAEQYTPDGILAGTEMWELVNTPVEKAAVQYPWEGLNDISYGIRMAELVTVCAGSGLGKSQFIREIIWHIVQNSTYNIGCLFLEENARKTGLSIMSLACDLPLHLPTTECSEETRRAAFDATLGTGRMFFFDHFGSTSIDNIVARVRYQAKALDCKVLFLDHVSIIVSAQENGDERKALDEVMTKLRTLVQELDICLFLVSHLKRPDGKGHEEGSATSISQLRGSASIGQLSDLVLGLERNGQDEDPIERNTTRIRVLKNRFSGETGKAAALLFSKETGRMLEVEDTTDVQSLENAL